MKDYLLVILSVVLLALSFILQKGYQKHTASTTESSVDFNIITSISSIIILILTSGFSISFTWFSVLNATLKALCFLLYTVIGFVIMKKSSVAMYMIFLMSGGMLVPTVWGWIFLGESPKISHISGVIVILIAIIINNFGDGHLSGENLLMCMAVFILNGFVSVLSKVHQINETYDAVPTVSYALIGAIASLLMSLLLKGGLMLKRSDKNESKRTVKFLPLLIVPLYSVLGSVSSILQLEGAKNLPASMLYPMITGGSIALTGIFALIFFGEKLSNRGWTSIALCFIGTCLFI